ncbi:MAG: cysteine-rich repeat protein [Bradymonadia bacterium]
MPQLTVPGRGTGHWSKFLSTALALGCLAPLGCGESPDGNLTLPSANEAELTETNGSPDGLVVPTSVEVVVWEFEAEYDPEAPELGLQIRLLDEASQSGEPLFDDMLGEDPLSQKSALWGWRGISTSQGAAGTVSLWTDPASIGVDASQCGFPNAFPYSTVGVFCADVTAAVHQSAGSAALASLVQLVAMITEVIPSVGHNGYAAPHGNGMPSSSLCANNGTGLNLPSPFAELPNNVLGLWDHSAGIGAPSCSADVDCASGDTCVQGTCGPGVQWVFAYTPEPFTFRGKILGFVGEEFVDGRDNDCDGLVDESLECGTCCANAVSNGGTGYNCNGESGVCDVGLICASYGVSLDLNGDAYSTNGVCERVGTTGVGYCQSCGDGVLWPWEQCDDGNLINNDGCNSSCELEYGDGIVGPSETCDGLNIVSGDGCDSFCQLEI